MEKTKTKYKNYYGTIGRKEEFFTSYPNAEDKTDQSQLASASITEMAKRFGIEAIESKATRMYIEAGKLQDQLYGMDLTKLADKETMLNTKKKLNNLFNNIPAKMRKDMFHDSVEEFINSFTFNDEEKLTQLNKIGLVSKTQLENVKAYNNRVKMENAENAIKIKFAEAVEAQKGQLYETFKKTGNIISGNMDDNTKNN